MEKEIINYLGKKKIGLIGFGRSNYAVAEILDKYNINFKVFDKNDSSDKLHEFKNSKIEYSFGDSYLDKIDCDILIRSPVVKYNDKIYEAIKNGTEISSEISLFLKFCRSKNIFAITGSDGKTTSSNIIYELLKKSGKKVFLGGNIGLPMISKLFDISKNDYVVIELSSFQLFDCKIKPKISSITNISENHLDWHKDFNDYLDSKTNIVKYQDENDLLVLNYDNKFSDYIKNKSKAKVRYFSLKNKISNGCFLDNDEIVFADNYKFSHIIGKSEIKIPGIHNIENFLLSISSCFDFVSINDIRYVCKNFSGVNHRIKFVDEINGVKYFNDSIASTPTRVVKGAFSVFDKNIVLIAGGYDKKLDFYEFAEYVCKKVKILVLMGQTSNKIEECVLKSQIPSKPKIFKVNSMKEAVSVCYRNSIKNDVVLLSPACASFGMYKDFEERGNDFKNCVEELKQKFF